MAQRDRRGRFVKGESGNPGGRPKVPDEVKTILKGATVQAAQLLVETITSEEASYSMRLDAAKEVLNRVYGKSPQPIDGELDAVVQFVLGAEVRELAE